MEVTEFRSKIKPNIRLLADAKVFGVREVVKFRFDDGSYYIKCFLSDNFVFADDLNEGVFLLVKEIKTPFQQPFPSELNWDGKLFKFLYTAHSVAEETQGEKIFKKGDGERFWDYKAEDRRYLSLGINDNKNQRLDFYGRIVENDTVKLG